MNKLAKQNRRKLKVQVCNLRFSRNAEMLCEETTGPPFDFKKDLIFVSSFLKHYIPFFPRYSLGLSLQP